MITLHNVALHAPACSMHRACSKARNHEHTLFFQPCGGRPRAAPAFCLRLVPSRHRHISFHDFMDQINTKTGCISAPVQPERCHLQNTFENVLLNRKKLTAHTILTTSLKTTLTTRANNIRATIVFNPSNNTFA